ncbi:type II toxin-antitoxin system HigB family toxin [Iningainema tapete]|uniref:Type II toxin-antitoxin system HigB family toxin n=1 Tax=Iningainema tapete BLCC-T55 TaxID=2748662 RepID=A0A8J6XEH2_9CYAN|nr:type II toxin-antitoxin system HigB family toxin [Iningainema tapete]MBD2772223.1 type II toxin-antitoxin system HigB family toxin [Iningainema tapete BLCC-T55]
MHIISQTTLTKAWTKHPDEKPSLVVWSKLVKAQVWNSFTDLKGSIPFTPDRVGNFVVFDIGGNKYRLITYIDYEYNKVFIRNFLTHAEYDKENWKKDEWYED